VMFMGTQTAGKKGKAGSCECCSGGACTCTKGACSCSGDCPCCGSSSSSCCGNETKAKESKGNAKGGCNCAATGVCTCAPGKCQCDKSAGKSSPTKPKNAGKGSSSPTKGSPSKGKAVAKAAAKAEDELDDMFADEPEEGLNDEGETVAEEAATKARQERMANALRLKEEKDAREGKVKKEKEVKADKSLVVLEVKPWEADTDLKMVWEKICEYKQEGLTWGASYKLEPIAYGIMKLVMTCTIVDSLVLMDDVTENIEALEEFVQSVNVASMNKIS